MPDIQDIQGYEENFNPQTRKLESYSQRLHDQEQAQREFDQQQWMESQQEEHERRLRLQQARLAREAARRYLPAPPAPTSDQFGNTIYGGSSLYKKAGTKVVLGKNKVIYKMKGSQKEYVKSKGFFVHISEYKKKSK